MAVAAAGEFGFGAFAAAPAGGFGASSPAEPRPTADQIPMFAQALKASLNPNELLEITMQFRKLLSIGAFAWGLTALFALFPPSPPPPHTHTHTHTHTPSSLRAASAH